MSNSLIKGIYPQSSQQADRAKLLALTLGLPILELHPEKEAYLFINEERMELIPGDGMGAICVDFIGGSVGHRRRFGGGRGQPIAKAVGLKGGANPTVIDATAGLGKDAFVLASLGCDVRMMERSPIIAALLEDGLNRAVQDPEIGAWIEQRMHFLPGSSIELLQQETRKQPAEVIYLDPMYPHRSKIALVKKEMRIFRQLVGDDEDASLLLETALSCAEKRVVVKRPRLAPAIEGAKVTMTIESKQTRFDVYVMAAMG